jgi:hypothetical protein
MDFGVSDMLREEYERFTHNLSALGDQEQATARVNMARARAADPNVKTVAIPGWDDVIHLRPRPTITPEMREAYWSARKSGTSSGLHPGIVSEIERRRSRAKSMATDATPAYARAWGQVMTAIDNVQDFLTTIVTLGRLALNPAVRLLEGTEAVLGRTAGLPFGVAGRVLGRVVPILTLPLLAADLLKLLNYLGLVAFPFFAAYCGGPKQALAAGVPALVFGRKLQLHGSSLSDLNPFAKNARLQRSATVRQWRPSIYNLMEVAQTTDQLFGVGLSFGGLVGTLVGGSYAAEAMSRGQKVDTIWPVANRQLPRSYQQLMGRTPTPAVRDYMSAGGSLLGAAVLSRTQEDFDIWEHAEALAAASAALSFLQPLIEHPAFAEAFEWALDQDWQPPPPPYDSTVRLLENDPELPPATSSWPLPGNPEWVRGSELFVSSAPIISAKLVELLVPRRESIEGVFYGALVMKLVERLSILITGSPDGVRWEQTPAFRIIESLPQSGYLLDTSQGADQVDRFFTAATAWLEEHNRKFLPPEVIEQLAEVTDTRLIALRPPDWPVPVAFLGADRA